MPNAVCPLCNKLTTLPVKVGVATFHASCIRESSWRWEGYRKAPPKPVPDLPDHGREFYFPPVEVSFWLDPKPLPSFQDFIRKYYRGGVNQV